MSGDVLTRPDLREDLCGAPERDDKQQEWVYFCGLHVPFAVLADDKVKRIVDVVHSRHHHAHHYTCRVKAAHWSDDSVSAGCHQVLGV